MESRERVMAMDKFDIGDWYVSAKSGFAGTIVELNVFKHNVNFVHALLDNGTTTKWTMIPRKMVNVR